LDLPASNASRDNASRRGAFATTHWSLVLEAGGNDSPSAQVALETLCRTYWPAIYAYIRRTGQAPENARDLTQAFFARLLDRGLIAVADRNKGRFRTFLLTLLQRFLADQHDHDTALKRGGGEPQISFDQLAEEEARSRLPADPGRSPELEFDRRWALASLDNAFLRLRAEAAGSGQIEVFTALQDHLGGGDPTRTLAEIGEQFALGESALKMRLSRWRARYRELIRHEVVQTVPSLADVDEEMRHLLTAVAS
jgi:RNA polymerase sigma-70 factor (ECF subfamily)